MHAVYAADRFVGYAADETQPAVDRFVGYAADETRPAVDDGACRFHLSWLNSITPAILSLLRFSLADWRCKPLRSFRIAAIDGTCKASAICLRKVHTAAPQQGRRNWVRESHTHML
jgi:hypothetical protein